MSPGCCRLDLLLKTYVVTTGVVFALLTAVHVWRMFVERNLLVEPWFIGITVATALVALWASRVLWRSRRGAS